MDIARGTVAFSLAYAFFSATLLVVNKWALQRVPLPNVILAMQFFCSMAVAGLLKRPTTGEIILPTCKQFGFFLPGVFLFFLSLNSNFLSLQYLGVEMVIMLRVSSTFIVACGDWLFNGMMIPSIGSMISLILIFLASVYVFFDFKSFGAVGLSWGMVYVLSIASDQVFLKYFIEKTKMSIPDRMMWMNALSIPVALIAALWNGELIPDGSRTLENGILPVACSCLLAVGISYTAWETRERVSALSFTLIGVLCKIITMTINTFFFAHLAINSLFMIAIAIFSTTFYKQAEKRDMGRSISQMDKRPLGKLDRLILASIITGMCIATITNIRPSSVPSDFDNSSDATYSIDPQPYSWHSCVGGSNTEDSFKYRSCHFKRVCYDGNENGILTYFASPTDDANEISTTTNVMIVSSDSEYEPYKINITRERMDDETRNRTIVWNDPGKATFFANFWRGGVWSHLVMDNFFPMFRILKIFGLNPYLYTFEPVAIHPLCDAPHGCSIQGNLFSDEWLSFFTRNTSFWWRTPNSIGTVVAYKKYADLNLAEGTLLCFSNAFTGLATLADHGIDSSGHGRNDGREWTMWGTGNILWEFRSYVLELAGFSEEVEIKRNLVVLMKGRKKHISIGDDGLSATMAVLERLFAERPELENETAVLTMETLSVGEQIEYMTTSKVALSVTGSTSFPSLWLPRGGRVVLLMREKDQRLDASMYNNLGYVKVQYFNAGDTDAMVKSILSGIDSFSSDTITGK